MTSALSSSRVRAALALALAVVFPASGRADGLDVKVWPLFRYARNDGLGELRWSALGPLVEYTRTREWRDLKIRPLLWLHTRRSPAPDERAEVLFPIMSLRRQAETSSLRFLLLSQRRESGGDGPDDDRVAFTLFPFVFYRWDATSGTRGGVFPFYLDLSDVFGYDEVRAVLFPAYLRLSEPRVERRFWAFPFVSTVGGPDGRGFRLWPFFGTTEIVGRERTSYVLWPFHVRTERLVPQYGWERTRLDLPVYASLEGEHRRTRAWGVLAHTHTVDELAGTEAIGSPWPLVFRERRLGEDAWHTWRLAPFYGRSERGDIRSRFWLWPALRTTEQDTEDDFHFRRQDVLLVLGRRQEEWDEETGRRASLLTLFPVLRAATENGNPRGQVPALVDSILPNNRGVLAMWAPLYGLLRWDTSPGGDLDWNLLWGLVARERGRLRGPISIRTSAEDARGH